MAEQSNPFEEKARLAKATKLADILWSINRRSAEIPLMTQNQWDLAAMTAGVSAPSAKTRELVAEILKTREITNA